MTVVPERKLDLSCGTKQVMVRKLALVAGCALLLIGTGLTAGAQEPSPPPTVPDVQSGSSGGGIGAGAVHRVGGKVSPPRVLYAPDPQYSDAARRAKLQGAVVLWLIVDQDGKPHQIRVQRSLGKGLDEKAVEAVKKWRFKPAIKDGQPVAVMINVEVNFLLYDGGFNALSRLTRLGADPLEYPLLVEFLSSKEQGTGNDHVVNAKVKITEAESEHKRKVKVFCRETDGRCGHLPKGEYPGQWNNGRLEVFFHLKAEPSKWQAVVYAVSGN
jgi:TonB family protein